LSQAQTIPKNTANHKQPIVLIGGLFSSEHTYRKMQGFLQEISRQKVWIVPIDAHEWFGSITLSGWVRLLKKIEHTVLRVAQESKTGKVTLIGHSSGGILGRLFLSPEPLKGHAYNGLNTVDTLITLGSPHYNHKGAALRKWVEEKYPGAYFESDVRYISVAGKAIQGKRLGTPRESLTFWFYQTLCGEGDVWGDGFVPVPSALLKGSQQVIIDGIRHYSRSKHLWYGSREAVLSWWNSLDAEKPSKNF